MTEGLSGASDVPEALQGPVHSSDESALDTALAAGLWPEDFEDPAAGAGAAAPTPPVSVEVPPSTISDRPSTTSGRSTPASLFARESAADSGVAERDGSPAENGLTVASGAATSSGDAGSSPGTEEAEAQFWAQSGGVTGLGSERRGAPGWAMALVGVVVLALVAGAGYFAYDRFSGDSSATTEAVGDVAPATESSGEPGGSDAATSEETSAPDVGAGGAAAQADVDALRSQLDAALAELENTKSALAEAEARVAAADEHVELMRSWFTADVLSRADNAFNAEVQRACEAEAEPSIDNTTHTRFMGPAGTHVQLVAQAMACRAGG